VRDSHAIEGYRAFNLQALIRAPREEGVLIEKEG